MRPVTDLLAEIDCDGEAVNPRIKVSEDSESLVFIHGLNWSSQTNAGFLYVGVQYGEFQYAAFVHHVCCVCVSCMPCCVSCMLRLCIVYAEFK